MKQGEWPLDLGQPKKIRHPLSSIGGEIKSAHFFLYPISDRVQVRPENRKV